MSNSSAVLPPQLVPQSVQVLDGGFLRTWASASAVNQEGQYTHRAGSHYVRLGSSAFPLSRHLTTDHWHSVNIRQYAAADESSGVRAQESHGFCDVLR